MISRLLGTPDDAGRPGWIRVFWIVPIALSLAAGAPVRAGDLASLGHDEIAALQQRLTDAGCYRGAVDGAASPALDAAVKECPDQRPVLRIETGMHVAVINRIGVDSACRTAVTGSDDKAVRVWSLPDGKLQRTLRLPIGSGDNGKVYAVALSPDGRTAAAGGWDAYFEQHGTHAVTLFDPATGENLRRIGSFGNVILHLAFSPDGTRLAVALFAGGVHVLDVGTGREIMVDPDFAEGSYGIVFGPDGSLFATGWDGFLRRYGPDLKRTAKIKTPQAQPYAVAVDPTGTRLAVGYNDSPQVDLFDAATLKRTGSADTRDVDHGDLSKVAWTHAGRLVAGGTFKRRIGEQWTRMVRTFDARGRRLGTDAAVAADTIFDLQPCGADLAFAAGDPSFGLMSAEGSVKTLGRGRTADMRDKLGTAFALSAEGTTIAFGLAYGDTHPVRFDLAAGTLDDGTGPGGDLHPADVTGLPVDGWESPYGPKLDGKALVLDPYERSHALAVRPDRAGFVLGTAYWLRGFDAAGTQRWQQAVPGEAWGANLARDGALIAAAYGDGTIRWHRWSDGQELLALFVDAPTKRWVAWTPTGYYKASPGGEDLIGWHVNRGWSQAADFFPASKFRDIFARPDIVDKVLVTLDEAEAVKEANAARPQKAASAGPVTEKLPPVLSILSPADGAVVGDQIRIDYLVRSPSGLPVEGVEALINGRPASAERGFNRLAASDAVAQCLVQTRGFGRMEGAVQGCRGSLTVNVPLGSSEIGLIAHAGDRTSVVTIVHLTRQSVAPDIVKPKLYALVVGISAYKNPDYRLGFPAKDAHDFAEALANQKGGLYRDVEVRLLADGDATANGIRDGLDWLTRQVTQGDTGIVFLAGHGALDTRDRFYFLASDSDFDRLRATALPRDDIADALDALAGHAMLFLDACHAGAVADGSSRRGAVDVNQVLNDFSNGAHGVVTFGASTGKQVSQENPAWGNGAFTKAVVEALGLPGARGKADFLGDGRITTSELDLYVRERVKVLTNGTQSPVMIRPGTVPDFPFAIARQ